MIWRQIHTHSHDRFCDDTLTSSARPTCVTPLVLPHPCHPTRITSSIPSHSDHPTHTIPVKSPHPYIYHLTQLRPLVPSQSTDLIHVISVSSPHLFKYTVCIHPNMQTMHTTLVLHLLLISLVCLCIIHDNRKLIRYLKHVVCIPQPNTWKSKMIIYM